VDGLGDDVCAARMASADAGVLVPAGRQQPDAAIFSLDEMTIEIRVDNGDARVTIRQIFGSHTPQITKQLFLRPAGARHGLRFRRVGRAHAHSGVILERRRAEEITRI